VDGEEVILNENEHSRCVELMVGCRFFSLYLAICVFEHVNQRLYCECSTTSRLTRLCNKYWKSLKLL